MRARVNIRARGLLAVAANLGGRLMAHVTQEVLPPEAPTWAVGTYQATHAIPLRAPFYANAIDVDGKFEILAVEEDLVLVLFAGVKAWKKANTMVGCCRKIDSRLSMVIDMAPPRTADIPSPVLDLLQENLRGVCYG